MKEVGLKNGVKVKVDDKDSEKVSNITWYLSNSPRSKGYAYARIDQKTTYMHRLILGAQKGQFVDHINGDCWDNRRANLRITDALGNAVNKRKHRGASSDFKGVSWSKVANKWTASLGHNYKVINLGYFSSEEEAARAWDKLAFSLYGDFAKLNYA